MLSALVSTAILSSCSRPVAYFQPTAREHYTSTQPKAATPVKAEEAVVAQEATVAPEATVTPATPSSAEQVAQVKQAVNEVEAYVRNDNKLASSKKLTKRLARLNEMLTSNTKSTVASNNASEKKMSFMERTVLKKMDKKIKNHVAPEKAKYMNSTLKLGLIIGLIGLLLWLLGGGSALAVIGFVAFIVGVVLIILGVVSA